jgi:hypothetical protein
VAYVEIASRVVDLWNDRFAAERPFLSQFEEWYGTDYPVPAGQPRTRAKDQGVVQPDTDFVECLANARSYAGPHLMQFAEALDHERAATLQGHLTADHEVIVVDVGCAAGILSLFADRAGFAHYIGVDTNRWMRLLSRSVFESVMDELTGWMDTPDAPRPHLNGYGGCIERTQYTVVNEPPHGTRVSKVRTLQPSFGILEDIDSHDGWSNFVRRVAANTDFSAPRARRITVLLVMNHLMFQLHDVPRTVTSAIDKCRRLASLPGVNTYLVSIEPGTLYKPGRLGTQGLERVLLERQLGVERYSVTGLSSFLTGNSKGDAAVRLVRFGS